MGPTVGRFVLKWGLPVVDYVDTTQQTTNIGMVLISRLYRLQYRCPIELPYSYYFIIDKFHNEFKLSPLNLERCQVYLDH